MNGDEQEAEVEHEAGERRGVCVHVCVCVVEGKRRTVNREFG